MSRAKRVVRGEGRDFPGLAPRVMGAVGEGEGAAVRLDDLLRKNEADAAATGFGGVEGHEEVGGVGEPRPVVEDVKDGGGGGGGPAEGDVRDVDLAKFGGGGGLLRRGFGSGAQGA